MTVLRKTLLGLGAFVALSLAALIVLPFVFKDRIAERVRNGVNGAVDARIDWGGVGLSFLRDFPNVTFFLDDLTVEGIDRFEGDTLASLARVRIVLDAGSVIRGLRKGDQIVVRSIELDEPDLYLRVLADGTANWNITRPRAEPAGDDAADFNIGLHRFEIRNARVALDNQEAGLFAALDGLDHMLSGDLTRDRVVLRTRTRAGETTVRFAGVPYLERVALEVKADITADMTENRFSFGENEVRLNDLLLRFSGDVGLAGDDIALDIAFEAPGTDLKQILSLVPAIYSRNFASLQTSGAVAVNGRVNGTYGENAFPAFSVHATVADGTFRYPHLPLPARNIFADLAIDNAGHDLDSTVVNLKRVGIEIGGESIAAALMLRTPVSDPDVDLRLDGTLDLAAASRTFDLEGVEELSGSIAADIAVRTRVSYLDNAQYERVTASGDIAVRNVKATAENLPHDVAIDELLLRLSPRRAELTSFNGRIGSSDVQASGQLDNLLGFALRDEELRGSATLRSGRFDLDEWRSEDEDRDVILVPANIDFVLDATIGRLTYGALEMSDAHGTLRVKDQRLTLEGFRLSTLGGDVALTGYYETAVSARPLFDVGLEIERLDIPSAFARLSTVQKFAPVAQYARGSFSADLRLNGALGDDMMPLFDVLNGRGSLLTSQLQLLEFPAMNVIASRLKLQQLENPTLDGIRSTFAIRDGRLHVNPFDVKLGDATMRVAGSNGLDQSLQYRIAIALPRALFGPEAERAVTSLISQAGRAGLDFESADVIELGIELTGTVTNPSIRTDVARGITSGLQQTVGQQLEAVGQRADATREEARRQAQAEADRLVREAEAHAEAIREEARKLAEEIRSEGNQQADALLERASGPVARAAARPAADRLRKEAQAKADQIEREADARAADVMAEARKKADALLAGTG